MEEDKPTAAESYYSEEDRRKFFEVQKAAELLIEKIGEELEEED